MAPRTDQLQSYRFTLQRIAAALAIRDPDAATVPARGMLGALVAGILIGALAVGAVGVYGLLRPGGDGSWRDGNSLIVERETGARFLYLDGILHPVLNYSSALLVLGAPRPPMVPVSRASLADAPRGAPVGIPGAPDLIPAPPDLLAATWTVCSRAASPAEGAGGPRSVLLIGFGPATAEPLGRRGLLARDVLGGVHLIWNHRRFAIRDAAIVLTAFGWRGHATREVATAVLNSIPAGTDLAPIRLGGVGEPSRWAGTKVGDVVVAENQSGAKLYGVAVPAGLAQITEIQADMLLAAGTRAEPRHITPARYASAPAAPSLIPAGDAAWPASAPELAPVWPDSRTCAVFAGDGGPPEIDIGSPLGSGPDDALPAGSAAGGAGQASVDRVVVAPGRGAIVESLPALGSTGGSLSLVTDLGIRYAVPSVEILEVLGYSGVTPHRLPAAVVALLPSGPALDPEAARIAIVGG